MDSGSICIQGQEIAGLGLNEMNRLRIKMGFLFQHAALYDSLTVEQNVAFPLERHTKMSASERERSRQGIVEQRWHGAAISTRCRVIFQEACKSGWAWRARWRCSRKSCFSMSPQPDSIRSPPAKSTIWFLSCKKNTP